MGLNEVEKCAQKKSVVLSRHIDGLSRGVQEHGQVALMQ
jgi:hypothetical protein